MRTKTTEKEQKEIEEIAWGKYIKTKSQEKASKKKKIREIGKNLKKKIASLGSQMEKLGKQLPDGKELEDSFLGNNKDNEIYDKMFGKGDMGFKW